MALGGNVPPAASRVSRLAAHLPRPRNARHHGPRLGLRQVRRAGSIRGHRGLARLLLRPHARVHKAAEGVKAAFKALRLLGRQPNLHAGPRLELPAVHSHGALPYDLQTVTKRAIFDRMADKIAAGSGFVPYSSSESKHLPFQLQVGFLFIVIIIINIFLCSVALSTI